MPHPITHPHNSAKTPRGYLAQLPIISDGDRAPRSTPPLPPWQPEDPPAGFAVDFRYTSQTRDLDKFSVWLSLVANLAKAAVNPWDLALPRNVLFPETHHVAVHAVSSIHPPSYQTKSIIWTFQEAFAEYAARGQYSSASLTARLNGHPL
ncbi:MAG: hypothetical protein LQ346_005681, partial [Caloplaca aetnensis]